MHTNKKGKTIVGTKNLKEPNFLFIIFLFEIFPNIHINHSELGFQIKKLNAKVKRKKKTLNTQVASFFFDNQWEIKKRENKNIQKATTVELEEDMGSDGCNWERVFFSPIKKERNYYIMQ